MADGPMIVSVSEAPTLVDVAFLLGELDGLQTSIGSLTTERDLLIRQIAERDARIAKLEREVERQKARASSARGALLIQRTYGSQF